ncbi:MAG: DUF362 domain-containing protein [bacterium]|nr:MAG: DUF362 domain-containing protein [bacterium]
MKKITRREFLKISAGSAVVAGVPFVVPGCSNSGTEYVPPPPPQVNAQVVAVRGTDLYEMSRNVLAELGGIESIINPGEKVFIKPNMVTLPWAPGSNCFLLGECTKVEILVAVAEECLKAGAAEVIIGDGSQMYTFDWGAAVTLDGQTNLLDEAARLSGAYSGNVTLACLETDSPGWVEVPSRTPMGSILISDYLTEADRVISIAVAKTHISAQLTLGLKNFVGVTSLDRYAVQLPAGHWERSAGLDHSSPQAISQIFLDVVDAVRPDLTLIDFSIGVEGNGPTTGGTMGRPVNMNNRLGSWLLLGSTDIIAADATAARVMSHNAHAIQQLRLGYDMGLGEIYEASIELKGEKLTDIQVDWEPAVLRNTIRHHMEQQPIYAL